MRNLARTFALALLSSLFVCMHASGEEAFGWDRWRSLAVLDGGRAKPLDSLARETFRAISNRVDMTDPDSGQRLDAVTWYLVMLMDWRGWTDAATTKAHGSQAESIDYFTARQPDKWDETPLLRVDNLELRSAFKWGADQKFVSPLDVYHAKLVVPATGKESSLLRWAQDLAKKEEPHSRLERDALQLASRFQAYVDHRMGKRLCVLPTDDREDVAWMSVASLLKTTFNETSDPTGAIREAQEGLRAARAAYLQGSAEEFNLASARFFDAAEKMTQGLSASPVKTLIDLEVAYNHWAPFRFAWMFTLISFTSLLLALGTRWRVFYVVGWATFTAGFASLIAGFAMRVIISGRAPVTNMYESVVFVGAGVALLGMALEAVYRKKFILTAAAAVATVTLVLADNSPVVLDASIAPLQPVLRNNFWLVTHVMTITLSYAALALALGIGNITLGYFLCGSTNQTAIESLSKFNYRAIQIGVLLLAAGTILGGVWADYSWGRFWGWDPKEVWALVALLGYLAALHARFAGWVHQFGMSVLSVLCFSLVVMAWYGVNFVLGAGLHSYGFGESNGAGYVAMGLILQGVYVLAATICYAAHRRQSAAFSTSQASTTPRRDLAPEVAGVSLSLRN